MEKTRVLMICMGNICRSPLAQGVFEHLVREEGIDEWVEVDSAGTHAYHVGNPPDPRSITTASRRGIDLGGQRARQYSRLDFEQFDYVLAMDRDNLSILLNACPEEHRGKVRLFLEFAPQLGVPEVPDPYYGGPAGFEQVYELVVAAARGLVAEIQRNKQ